MPDSSPLWITEADVVAMMDMADAIDALEQGLRAEARGVAKNMEKTYAAWNGSTLHAIGAVFPEAGFAGTKTWAHTEGGATPLLILFDSHTGALKAIIEAFALGQMRTGGASGVATRWLAAEQADELAIIGTGQQALTQVAAVVAVRPIRRIRVFGRNEARRAQLVTRAREEFGVEVVAAQSIADCVKDAPIITVVTRATEPIVNSDMIASGAHLNAVGAIVPTRAEIADDVLARCSQIVVDSLPQAQKLSKELIDYFGSGRASWDQVQPLADLVAAQRQRAVDDDLTLFKSLGRGISDLSLGVELFHRAIRLGLGRGFPHPQRATVRLRATTHTRNQGV
jgi:ornithine cyclodeaminase